MVGCCPGGDAGSCARPHDVPSRLLRRLRRRSSARRRRDQEGRRDPANPVSLGSLGAKGGRSPTTASGSTRPTRLTLVSECANVDELLAASVEAFRQHPDYHIVTSFPGLGDITGAPARRDWRRPATIQRPPRSQAFAGAAPITVPPVAARRSPAGG